MFVSWGGRFIHLILTLCVPQRKLDTAKCVGCYHVKFKKCFSWPDVRNKNHLAVRFPPAPRRSDGFSIRENSGRVTSEFKPNQIKSRMCSFGRIDPHRTVHQGRQAGGAQGFKRLTLLNQTVLRVERELRSAL